MPDPRPIAVFVLALAAACSAPATARHGPHAHGPDGAEPPATAPTATAARRVGTATLAWESVPGWCRLPDGAGPGSTHGAIVIDRAGRVYSSTDAGRAIMVHEADGTFVRSFPPEFAGIHGMVLRREGDAEFIYAAHLAGRRVVKLALDGTVQWALGVPTASGKYDDDPAAYHPTAVAVAPNGDVYVADGYGRNWIHHYRADRTYVRSFGGPGAEPGRFRTCHGLALDTRGERPLLVVCDRENRRLQRFALDGTFVDVVATGLRRPCGLSIRGDLTAVAELEGRVTILDRNFAVVTHLGDNPRKEEWANHGVAPEAWVEGVFTAPHGCCFDRAGNLYVSDWNAAGRISKLRRLP